MTRNSGGSRRPRRDPQFGDYVTGRPVDNQTGHLIRNRSEVTGVVVGQWVAAPDVVTVQDHAGVRTLVRATVVHG